MLTLCLVLLAVMIVIGAPIAYVIGLPVTLIILFAITGWAVWQIVF